jgi:hypothetical protein
MNQLTTIAALPSGAGQAAHLKPEVHSARELLPLHPANWHRNAYHGGVPSFTFTINTTGKVDEACARILKEMGRRR